MTSSRPVVSLGDVGQLRSRIRQLEAVRRQVSRMDRLASPAYYGLPDLQFRRGEAAGAATEERGEHFYLRWVYFQETPEEYTARQDRALVGFVEGQLRFKKDGTPRAVQMHRGLTPWITDLFFKRVHAAIIWGPRGGGKSLGLAVLIWLTMTYRRMSFMDVAGSEEQALEVFRYVESFWESLPRADSELVTKSLRTTMRLASGVSLRCVAASPTGVRGKHPPAVVVDEGCQEDGGDKGNVMRAAIQGPLSEPESMTVIASTFHFPDDFFSEHWDQAEAKGIKRYKFTTFDTMAPCTIGLQAPDGDTLPITHPDAVRTCQGCYLTLPDHVYDKRGELVAERWRGCYRAELGHGIARTARGWQSYDSVAKARRLNEGSDLFFVEHACERPPTAGRVYDPGRVDRAREHGDEVELIAGEPPVFGLDWGWGTGRLVILLLARAVDKVAVLDGRFVGHATARDVHDIMCHLEELWGFPVGATPVHPDAASRAENVELAELGREVTPVDFAKLKDYGIRNVRRYLETERLQILRTVPPALAEQLKKYKTKRGRAVKKADHGPDALLCGLLRWPFTETFERRAARG